MTRSTDKDFCYLIATSGLLRDIFLLEKLFSIEETTEAVVKRMRYYEMGKHEFINRTILDFIVKDEAPESKAGERQKWKDYLDILKDIEKNSGDSKCKEDRS